MVKPKTMSGIIADNSGVRREKNSTFNGAINSITINNVGGENDIAAVKTDLTEVKTDMTAVKTDMTAVKTDLTAVKTDMTAVKTDLNEVKTDMTELKQHDDDFDTEFTKHIARSDNNFSIDNIVTSGNEFVKCINKLNFTLNVIRKYEKKIKKQGNYSSVLRPIFETKYTDNEVSIDGYVAITTIEPVSSSSNKLEYIYFWEPDATNDNKTQWVDTLLNDQRYKAAIYNETNELREKYPDQLNFYVINWYEWSGGVKVTISSCIPDILKPGGPWIRILAGVNITPYFSSITSVDLIPQSYKKYLGQLQDAFNNYIKTDYNPSFGTIYQFGEDNNFYKLLVVSSEDYPQWNDKRIADSYIPGSNIDMPTIIFNINAELNRNYSGMSEGEIVIVQYAVGATYYTGVVKMLRIEGYGGLCYQIQSINIHELFPTSVSMTGDVAIQGNLNILRYDGEKVISTDNTRKVTSFHDKVGINQHPYEVEGLLDIDNLTQQTVLDLFNTFVPYSVNSTDIIQVINDLPSKLSSSILDLFGQGKSLFDYKNQCTVFSVPIKAILTKDDISIIHTDGLVVSNGTNAGTVTGLGKSIITSDYSFTRLQQVVKEINQMAPEFENANDSSFVFSFLGILQSLDKKSYMKSARAIIDSDRLIFVITYLDVTTIMNDDSTGKPLLNVMNYMSKEYRFVNYVSLLFKDTTTESGFYDASGNLAKDDKGNILLQRSIQKNEYFSDRLGLLPESYIVATDYDDLSYVLNEDKLQWNSHDFTDIWNNSVNVKDISDHLRRQRNKMYNNAINSTNILSFFWNSFVRVICSNIITVGIGVNKRTLVIDYGFYLNTLLNQSLIVKGDNTISGNFFVNDSNNNNIFKVDNVKKTITNMYKVGIGMDEPSTILDIKDTTVSDILSQLDAGTQQYNLLNKIATELRAAAADASFNDTTDFGKIIDQVYTDLDIEQTIDNYTCLYKLNMDTMLAKDILVCRHWLYPGWDGKAFGNIQDATNKFSLKTLKKISSDILNEDMIYDNCTILRFFSFVFGWKFIRILGLKIGDNMYLLGSGTNVQNFGLRPDSNTNITTSITNGIRSNMMNNRIYTYLKNITTIVNDVESLNELRKLDIESKDIPITSFILTIDSSDIKKITYQDISLNEDLTSVVVGDIINIPNFDDYNIAAKYKNFWIVFDNKKYQDNMSINSFNVITYEDLYTDYVTAIKCMDVSGTIITLLCTERRIQDIIKPSLSVEGDAKITGDLLVTNKASGEHYVSIDPDNHFMGIGTDERFINYQDRVYTTTSNMYAGRHNVNISYDTYPVMVVERIREFPENDLSGNLESFRSYSTLTAKRRSKLYEFSDLVAKANEYNEQFKADHPSDAVSHMKYGPDISFEVCDGTDRTVELGQIGMNIDTMEDNGHLRGGFSVHVFDPQGNDKASKSTKRGIMYVDNSSTLFVNQISLNGGVLSSDSSGTNLYWNGKKLVTED